MRITIAWPPEKPTSTRLSSSLSSAIRLDELGQDAARSRWMQECHEAPSDSAPGLMVNRPQATLLAELERSGDVLAAVRGVVDAGSALCDEPPHRRVVAQRREQLDVRIPDAEKRRLHPLLRDGPAMLERHLEELAVQLDRRIEVLDRDADVVDALEHTSAAV